MVSVTGSRASKPETAVWEPVSPALSSWAAAVAAGVVGAAAVVSVFPEPPQAARDNTIEADSTIDNIFFIFFLLLFHHMCSDCHIV